MKKIILLYLLLIHCSILAQKEGNIWYFGQNAGIDFNSGVAVAITNGQLSTIEGCATISDHLGNLLFYTDGSSIWNSNHIIMPNGSGLLGDPSSTQSAIIVKKPGSNTVYYVFTIDAFIGSDGLTYSEVDMSLQSGLGDVNFNKNVPIIGSTSEKITAVRHQNGIDFWIIINIFNTNTLQAYLLSSNGLNLTPVSSNVGPVVTGQGYIGCLKGSQDGSRLAMACSFTNYVGLFDFDNSTGVISNPVILNGFGYPGSYGVEFSKNGDILYVSSDAYPIAIYQYDLLAGSQAAINASKISLGLGPGNGGSLQLAPDGKIYQALTQSTSLGVVDNPNILGVGCNYGLSGFTLGAPRVSTYGLPNFFNSIFTHTVITWSNSCFGNPTFFNTSSNTPLDSVLWDFGDPNSGVNNTSLDTIPIHLFTYAGTFNVTLITYSAGIANTIVKQVTIIPFPTVFLGNDTTLCQGETIDIDATTIGATYLWQDSSSNPIFNVIQQGTYWVEVSNICGRTTDTIHVNYNQTPIISIGNDTTLCSGQTITLNATTSNATYIWQDNSTSPIFNVTQQGNYWVQVTTNNCISTDTIHVSYNQIPINRFGNDTTLCQGDTLILNATAASATYLWQDSSSSPIFSVTQQGTYWVEVINICGRTTDTIHVNYNQTPIISIGNDTTLCQGETIDIDATTIGATYLWQDSSSSPIFSVIQQGTYWVEVTNICGRTTDTIHVNYNQTPIISIGNDTTLCPGQTITLDATTSNATYIWQDNSTSPIFSVTQQGTYWVEVTNICGSTTEMILIDEKCEIILELPNAFTPNNDDYNDLFVPLISEGIVSMSTVIYNRWGNKVYETNKILIEWNGQNVSNGIYFWIINYTDINAVENGLHGHVTILK